MIVETGAGIQNADSYASEAALEAYADARGIAFTGEAEPALIIASAYIDGRYRRRFPGIRRFGRAQGLEWPRVGAVDGGDYAVPSDAVPPEVVTATIMAALQHLASPGSLYPVDTGTSTAVVKRERLGSMEVEYDTSAGNTAGAITLAAVDDVLAGLLGPIGSGMVRLVRA